MFHFNFRAWLRGISGRSCESSTHANRRSTRLRPVLQMLEGRLTPATLFVNTSLDNTTDTSHLTLRDAVTLVNNDGDPNSLGQSSMPNGWATQTTGAFG